ncbi:MAG: binding--dependent transport system inner rane component family protein [Frankiales bacterium]|nr:binding--dependent transport system inner rane component family protein [Frankiales bacterium]
MSTSALAEAPGSEALPTPPGPPGLVPRVLARARSRRRSRVDLPTRLAFGFLVLVLLSAVFAPLLTPYDPLVGDISQRLLSPGSPGHLLGTDEQGRDIATRLMFGARLSLLAAVLPVAVASVLALACGLIAGSRPGLLGTVLMRVLDVFFAFPAIMLAIGVAAALGPGLHNAFGALVLVFTPPLARVVEAATRHVAGMEYVQAAQLTGATRARILVRQVLPNVLPPVLTYAASLMGVSLLLMAGLSFVGLGVRPPTPEWGFMLGSMRDMIYTSPVNAILPGIAIFLTAVALNVVSDGLRDAADRS